MAILSNILASLILISISALIVGMASPKVFSWLFKNRSSRAIIGVTFGACTVFLFILFGMVVPPTDESISIPGSPQVTKQAASQEPQKSTAIEYKIISSEDNSLKALDRSLSSYEADELRRLPTNKRMSYRVVVKPTVKEAQVTPIIEKVIADLRAKDKDVDEIMVFIYSDEELAKSEDVYDVGRGIWAPGGEWGSVTADIARTNDRTSYQVAVDINENLEEYLRRRGETENKFGLTEEQRKTLFTEIVIAENKARIEADKLYPVDPSSPNREKELDLNITKMRELEEEYKGEVRAKYGISEDVEIEITVEAFDKHWPMPGPEETVVK